MPILMLYDREAFGGSSPHDPPPIPGMKKILMPPKNCMSRHLGPWSTPLSSGLVQRLDAASPGMLAPDWLTEVQASHRPTNT